MKEEHLNFLSQINFQAQGGVGRNALTFGNQVQNIEILPEVLNRKFDRNGLYEIRNNNEVSNLALVVAILSWGGMRFDHARLIFKNWDNLNQIVDQLRKNQITTRQSAFERFQNARQNGLIKGLGIGYFTKLICFVNPNLNGYILDQWTGKSTNLLWNDRFVEISKAGWVTDNNNAKTYEIFCLRIEHIAVALNCEPIDAEERIFSVGGRNRGVWRQYLMNHYQ